MTRSVGIVGAGPAGTAVAHELDDADCEVTLFEKDRNASGRAATRRRLGCTYDYGANYVTDEDERVNDLLADAEVGLVDVDGSVWTFDADGTVSEGRHEDRRLLSYTEGIAQLGERLLDGVEATVLRETPVERLTREADGWLVGDAGGHEYGTFDALVLTPPAPLTADLLGSANWAHRNSRVLREAIESVPYRTVTSAVLHYPFALDRPYYALVNEDDGHDVGWVSREGCKEGHVPDGESLLVVQFAADWSVDNYGAPDADIAAAAAERVGRLLGDERLSDPDWSDVHRFRYALPDGGLDDRDVATGERHDLFLAGDWVAGEGRVHRALRSGVDTAARLREQVLG